MTFSVDDYSASGGYTPRGETGHDGNGDSGMEEFVSETYYPVLDAHGWGDGYGDGEGDN